MKQILVISYFLLCPCKLHNMNYRLTPVYSSEQWRLALRPNTTVTLAIASSPDVHVVDPRHAYISPVGRLQWLKDRPLWRRGMASKGRMTMYGRMHKITRSDDVASLSNCFFKHHPDAEAWKPGASESPHTAFWVRFSPHEIHYVGGFGDEHFIGAVDMQQYRSYDVRIDADATASSLSPPSRSLELPVVHFQS